jgi:hypothetical protein
MTVEQLEAEALKLPAHERARLAQRLLASLDEDPEIERAWEDVAEARYQQYLAGEVETVSASEALAEIGRRSEARRRSPGEAAPLDEALDRIERSLP